MAIPVEEDNEALNSSDTTTTRTDFETAQSRVFEEAGIDVHSRFIDLENPPVRVHVVEAGNLDSDEPPIVFVHGGSGFGAFFAPLMAQFDDVRMITFDRPGYGLSDEFVYTKGNIRRNATDVIGGVLDVLAIEQVDLVGHSGGGYASIQFALVHPDRVRRLNLVGAVANFPGTRLPLPFRLMTVPLLDQLLQRLQKPGVEGVLDFAALVGEREALQRYPALVRAMAAHQDTPQSAEAGVSEIKAHFSIWGWHSSVRIGERELQNLQQPTLVIVGDNDPFGGSDDVRDGVERIPVSRLETTDSGHAPFFGYPERCAQLIREARDPHTFDVE